MAVSARQKTASGTYAHPDELESSADDLESGGAQVGVESQVRDSFDSIISDGSIPIGVCTPRQMKLLMSEEDRRKYEIAQQMQQQASKDGKMRVMQPNKQLSDVPLRRANYMASEGTAPLEIQGYDRVAQGDPSEASSKALPGKGSGATRASEQPRLSENLSFASRMARERWGQSP
ncbi:hypothetical protein NM208_g16072 [Fusarium decemcellulare]|uniref:Uncharacterized protein n=1 Tax=Fusarium decemcellulare TaxID=57161 RepID=A0ACC1RDW7_9HYPO|nr:hypothetical protein NM208_g16072 [Fusarium decemcellulare]